MKSRQRLIPEAPDDVLNGQRQREIGCRDGEIACDRRQEQTKALAYSQAERQK